MEVLSPNDLPGHNSVLGKSNTEPIDSTKENTQNIENQETTVSKLQLKAKVSLSCIPWLFLYTLACLTTHINYCMSFKELKYF